MRTIIITSANETYMPLLAGLIQSLNQWHSKPYTSLGVFDLGLEDSSIKWISKYTDLIIKPSWDFNLDKNLQEKESHLRALTVRPFLPKYFPGYDTYLWIDSDAWVQNKFAIELYLTHSIDNIITLTPEFDRSYNNYLGAAQWRSERMKKYFGSEISDIFLSEKYYNTGVFALSKDSTYWEYWQKYFEEGINNTNGMLCCDQTALNYAIWKEKLKVHPLPATCNWLCHLSIPKYDEIKKLFIEPYEPSNEIGILHLAYNSKNLKISINDSQKQKSLRFSYKK